VVPSQAKVNVIVNGEKGVLKWSLAPKTNQLVVQLSSGEKHVDHKLVKLSTTKPDECMFCAKKPSGSLWTCQKPCVAIACAGCMLQYSRLMKLCPKCSAIILVHDYMACRECSHPILKTVYQNLFSKDYLGLQQMNQLNLSHAGGTRAHKSKLEGHNKNGMHQWATDMYPALFDSTHKERVFLRRFQCQYMAT
jgi:hypothetical protein